MNEKQVMRLNSEPWILRQMSVKELLDTAALAKALFQGATPSLQHETTLLYLKCTALAGGQEQNKLKECWRFH